MDLLLLTTTVFIVPAPFFIFSLGLYLELDPYYFILGDIFGDPNYENVTGFLWNLSFLLRAFTLLCVFESTRTISFAAMILCVVLKRLLCHVQKLFALKLSNRMSLTFGSHMFKLLSVLNGLIRGVLQDALSVSIFYFFWSVVVYVWLAIRALNVLPTYVHLLLLTGLVLVVISGLIFPTLFTEITEKSKLTTIKFRHMATLFYTQRRRKRLLVLKKVSLALRPIIMYYRPFIILDRKFCSNMNANLVSVIINVLLVF